MSGAEFIPLSFIGLFPPAKLVLELQLAAAVAGQHGRGEALCGLVCGSEGARLACPCPAAALADVQPLEALEAPFLFSSGTLLARMSFFTPRRSAGYWQLRAVPERWHGRVRVPLVLVLSAGAQQSSARG